MENIYEYKIMIMRMAWQHMVTMIQNESTTSKIVCFDISSSSFVVEVALVEILPRDFNLI
jgi:hypothetical protein